jgi:hypothetical protein
MLHGKEKSQEIKDKLFELMWQLFRNFSENDWDYLEPYPNNEIHHQPGVECGEIAKLLIEQGW